MTSSGERPNTIAAVPGDVDSHDVSMSSEVRRAGWWKLTIGLVTALLLLGLAVTLGPDIGERIVAMERWVDGHGVLGAVVFLGIVIVLTSMFFPDTVLAAAAGAMFGIGIGAVVMVVGAVVTQCIAFGISRNFLSQRVRRVVEQRPKLAAIERAANSQGLRLQILLRLSPLNPVAVSHVIGVTQIRFPIFLVACVGLIPGMVVEVYFGYTAKHVLKVAGNVSEHSPLHTSLTVTGLMFCILLMIYVTRSARQALAEGEVEPVDNG